MSKISSFSKIKLGEYFWYNDVLYYKIKDEVFVDAGNLRFAYNDKKEGFFHKDTNVIMYL